MKLDCVLTAVNENPMYFDFIPIFIKTWNKLYPTVDIKIVLISEKIPDNIQHYEKNIILFKPIKNISTSFTSQFIRLLYPSLLNYKNGIMITDIDDIPMNRTYFTQNIKNISDDKWINLRDWRTYDEICMCWHVATNKIWKEVFGINNVEDIKETLINVNNSINYVEGPGQSGWSTDQKILYKKVMEWNQKTNNYVYLMDKNTGFNRLDRMQSLSEINHTQTKKNISNGLFSDYHCKRPMSVYSEVNYEVYNLL